MIFTALENVHPLHNFDFLQCKIVTKTNPIIVKAIPIYAKVLHSELISVCVTAPSSFTWCKTKLAISV